MADLINLDAESGRNVISDDSTPTLELENTSSGSLLKLRNSSGSGGGIDAVTTGIAGTFKSTVTETNALSLAHDTAIASPTVAPLKVLSSAASGVAIDFDIGLNSSASISEMAGTVPVRLTQEDKVVYIPLYEIS